MAHEVVVGVPPIQLVLKGVGWLAGWLMADAGVLHAGCVQEEIRFCISPECLVSLLVCDRMAEDEAILLVGET